MDGQPQNTAAPKNNTGPIIAVVGIIVIVVVAVLAFQNMNQSQTANPTATEQTQQQPAQNESMVAEPTSAPVQASAYKDGTYTAVGNYTSPGGAETLGVTLTIANGVVTSSEVEVRATRPMSKTRQTDFKDNYKPQVEGKSIDEISLTKVSGSSLSPKGFNDAVEQIKQQAQS